MSDIRKYLRSRFGDEGRILELDYSQLEIFVLAHLSGDQQLKQDLHSGQDLHGISAAKLFGSKFTKAQRRIAKSLSFQLQYGAGYKSMAAQNNIPESLAKKFIDQYYGRYPQIRLYQERLQNEVEGSRRVTDKRTPKGYQRGKSKFQSETGRIYTFWEDDAPDWMANPRYPGAKPKSTTFSPTKIKNYQVQGYATGDIVPMVVGKLFRELCVYNNSQGGELVLFINTVHDSVVFDCVNELHAETWAYIAQTIMQAAPVMLKEHLHVDFSMPLRVDAEMGKNWQDMKEFVPTPF
jgi:DNA polymerase-1